MDRIAPSARPAPARGLRRLTLLPVLAVLVVACGAGAASPASPSVAPAPGGTITSQSFQPPVTMTLPPGWELAADRSEYLLVRPAGSETLGIHLFRDPVAASQDATCPAAPAPGVPGTSVGLSGWLLERPGLAASEPRLAAVGGLRGLVHDVGIARDWTVSCPFADGIPTVPLIVASGTSGYHWVMAGSERLRLYLLDVPGGGLVAIDVDDFVGDQMETLIAQSLPIIESMVFALPTASPVASPAGPGSAAPSPGASSAPPPSASPATSSPPSP